MKYAMVVERAKKIMETARKQKIMIYGAGAVTRDALKLIDSKSSLGNIVGLIDGDPQKHGSFIHGIQVFSPDYLRKNDIPLIVVNVQKKVHTDEIYGFLTSLGKDLKIVKLTLPVLADHSKVPDLINYIKQTGECPVVIYQMGKVGSVTIHNSLFEIGIPAWHIHTIARKLEKWRGLDGNNRTLPDLLTKISSNNHRKIKLISLVRDPAARNMAVFFQEIEEKYSHLLKGYENGVISLTDITDTFFHDYDATQHSMPIKWWENELRAVFGIDVLKSPFPKEKGYQIYETNNTEALVIKLEMLDTCVEEAFREFMGIQHFQLYSDNIGQKKNYRDVYRAFKEKIVFPKIYLDRLYDSRFVTHFYSNEEIKGFRRKLQER